jgi:transmembrane sensor
MKLRDDSPIGRALHDPLREPLGLALRDDLEEHRIKTMWEHIDHAPRRRPGAWVLALGTAMLVAAVLLITLSPARRDQRLVLTSGDVPTVLEAKSGASSPRFEDGSQVNLTKGSRIEVLRNDAQSFVTALRRGAAHFDVKPGGPRRWIVEAGELSVEVVGTRFSVERQGTTTSVNVEHGLVLVRGERVPSGVVRLGAGERFELRASSVVSTPSASVTLAPATPPPARVPVPGNSSPASSASASASAAGESEPHDAVDRELSLADVARTRRDHAAAVGHFEAAWRQAAPGDSRRGMAGLSLSRLLMTTDPAKAATILRGSVADMPQPLMEDAMARLVEAEARAGNAAAANLAAADYLRRFPQGRRVSEVRRWSGQ